MNAAKLQITWITANIKLPVLKLKQQQQLVKAILFSLHNYRTLKSRYKKPVEENLDFFLLILF